MTGKDIIKIAVNLVIIYVIGGVMLAAVYAWTSPIIFKKNKEEKEQALLKMMPEADRPPEKLGDWEPQHKHAEYYVAHRGEEIVGYIVETYGKGYSSYINVLVSVGQDLLVRKIDVLSHAETPGLGDEILEDYFKNQFVGKSLDKLEVVKTETTEKIQAITGATISSRAVTQGVKDGVDMLSKSLSGEKPSHEEVGDAH